MNIETNWSIDRWSSQGSELNHRENGEKALFILDNVLYLCYIIYVHICIYIYIKKEGTHE